VGCGKGRKARVWVRARKGGLKQGGGGARWERGKWFTWVNGKGGGEGGTTPSRDNSRGRRVLEGG